MTQGKLKIFCITNCPPLPTMGGAMAFYRHFFEREGFDVKVATNRDPLPALPLPYQPVKFGCSRVTQRLFRTRLMPWVYGPHLLISVGRVPAQVWQAAREFKPDAVLTIAGTWDYSALVAERVARQLRVPLIASFNDWFDFGWFPPHRVFHKTIEQRFRRFYREADLALCTCEGMKEALGPHSNAHVLYPIGSPHAGATEPFKAFAGNGRRPIVGFAGNLGEWYGPMVERLVAAAEDNRAPLEFRIYGNNPATAHLPPGERRPCYKGHLPFDQLRQAMAETDILLLPMGFDPRVAHIERTSFKTKFLDYLVYRKPIVVWGPEYCSAVRVAQEFDSAEICRQPDAEACLKSILALVNQPERQSALVNNAGRMYDSRFSPEKIHAGFLEQCGLVIKRNQAR